MSTFADPEIIKLARTEFVPIAADDWYQRRRQDAEGEFFRKMSDQGPRKGNPGADGGATRQGIYVFTAAGKLLMYRNHNDAEVMKAAIRQGLKEWQKLPADQREPNALKVGDAAKIDSAYRREPPAGALIVSVHTRILDKTDKGDFCHGKCGFPGGDRAAQDHLWLTAEEWRSLIPANARKGDTAKLPERLVVRIARFHLVDDTRGEPPHWTKNQIRTGELTTIVEDVNDKGMTLRLTGSFLLTTQADAAKADRGFDVRLEGTIHYDAAKKAIDRFDAVALGDHWGNGPLTRGARPGRTPLGIVFELSPGNRPADRVPPQGARWLQGYLEAEKR